MLEVLYMPDQRDELESILNTEELYLGAKATGRTLSHGAIQQMTQES